jgi:hypothetical protein
MAQFGAQSELTVGAVQGPSSTLPGRPAGTLPGKKDAPVHLTPNGTEPVPLVLTKFDGHFIPEFAEMAREFASAK